MPLDLADELAQLTRSLGAAGIEYALCGGLAMAVHGAPRATVDIDFIVLAFDLIVVTPRVEGAWRSRRRVEWAGGELSVVSRQGLVALKEIRSSAQDVADIERLERLPHHRRP